ncbi:hypothetical protein Tco_0416962 [Tanacetum coccineum]
MSSFNLEAYLDSDYGRANLDRKSTIEVTDQAKEIKHLKAQIKKLKKKAKPVITHHKAWMKSVSMKQKIGDKEILEEIFGCKRTICKTEDAQDVGRTSYVVHEEKESAEKGVSTEDPLSTAQPKIKRFDDSFISIGSAEDEKVIKEMNEQVADASKKRFSDEDKEVGFMRYLTRNIPIINGDLKLAIPEQIATGKGILNLLMAGILPKTINPIKLDVAVLLKRQVADEDG